MGFKRWLRKMLIEDATEAPQTPPQNPVLPPMVFEIDKTRQEILMSILHGNPFFCIFQTPAGVKTITTGLTPMQIRTALDEVAAQIPAMKEVLTNVAIDINAPQNAKHSENR